MSDTNNKSNQGNQSGADASVQKKKRKSGPRGPYKKQTEEVSFNGQTAVVPVVHGNQMQIDGRKRTKGDNTNFLRYARVAFDLPPVDISDEKQVLRRVNEYLDFCEENDRKPSLVGVSNWLGISRDTLQSWKRGEFRADTHQRIFENITSMLEELWVDWMMNGKVNPASGIFIGKNHYGYRDVQDVVVAPGNPLGDGVDKAQLADKYLSVTDLNSERYIDGTAEEVDD